MSAMMKKASGGTGMEASATGLLGGIFSRQGQANIHVKFSDVDWATIVRSGDFLTQQEVEMLRAGDESPVEFLAHNEAEGRKYVAILLKLMGNSTGDARAQHFAVSRADDIIADDIPRRARLFLTESGKPLEQGAFLRTISAGDAAVQQSASVVLALLIVNLGEDCESLIQWICRQLSTGRGSSQGVRGAVQALCVLLRDDEARFLFARQGGVGSLTRILRMQGADSSMPQLLYELCFCLWAVSLCEEARHDFMNCGTVAILAQQVAAATSEKVTRVSLAALKHLTEGEVGSFNAEMIACGLPKTLEHMKNQKFADPDTSEDVEILYKCLQANSRDLSTFERYSQEVMSGQLKWGVVHTEKFWREHAREVESDGFFILKQLIELLKSEDKSVVSIACFDIGEFVRFYPSGRTIVRHLGAKEWVMSLIESEHKDVQRQALLCISKIMVNKWEFVR